MSGLITVIIVASILGAGLITGLLFAFSNFIMRALSDLPSDKGMFAMQRINVTIINPVFMVLFLATPVLCSVIAFTSIQNINESGSLYLLIGALAYIIGPFGITMLFNVPLNNLLARTDVSASKEVWPMYQKRWQWWNHIRTYIGVASILFMTIGLGSNEPQ
ncbi:anthrone oxygenase family protein [Candidatus Nitrotoga sp. M5]|uniref:anthrone oxygenase family protein n=1 Tax=Candidatus Nitrotoga sp. M5 TaxID=2890409 RepID=UPI001EF3FCE0|nr:anthrone oxygenase family protein [Candidatus Nitrotoga sp. M5]CAH1387685.1 conserved membrane hypothetical protein [Candidatus Nitrotoga sp. M5]